MLRKYCILGQRKWIQEELETVFSGIPVNILSLGGTQSQMTSANVGFPGDSGPVPDIFVYNYTWRVSLVTKTGQFSFWVTFFTLSGWKIIPLPWRLMQILCPQRLLKGVNLRDTYLPWCPAPHLLHWSQITLMGWLLQGSSSWAFDLSCRPQRSPWFYISWLTVCYNQISPLNLICTSEYSLFIPSDSWILCWVSGLYFLISATSRGS